MTGDTRTIFNASDGPIPRDRAGRILAVGERIEVDDLEGLSGHIKADRIIVIEDAVAAIESEAKARKAATAKAEKAQADADALTAKTTGDKADKADDVKPVKADDKPTAPIPTTPRKGAATSTPQEG